MEFTPSFGRSVFCSCMKGGGSMRKATGSLVPAALTAGSLAALSAPAQAAAPQAKDPYAHTRLERV